MVLLITGCTPGIYFLSGSRTNTVPTPDGPLVLKVSRAFALQPEKEKIFLKGQNRKTSPLPLSDSAMEKQMEAQNADTQQATQGRPIASWVSILLDYFDQKARLLAVESKEASSHFIGLLVLLGVILVLALSSVVMYGAFLLYLVALLLHLSWGWSALICGVVLTLLSALVFFVLRTRLRKPVFQMSWKDLEKDKEWLTHSKTKTH
jgi:uncharacterized membrane protein YqjE